MINYEFHKFIQNLQKLFAQYKLHCDFIGQPSWETSKKYRYKLHLAILVITPEYQCFADSYNVILWINFNITIYSGFSKKFLINAACRDALRTIVITLCSICKDNHYLKISLISTSHRGKRCVDKSSTEPHLNINASLICITQFYN